MAHLPEKATHVPLSQIAIPGTHNSGSYGIQESSPLSLDMNYKSLIKVLGLFFKIPYFKWSVTQKTNFTTQLQSGIRYFDMRVAIKRQSCVGLLSNSSIDIYPCFFLVHGQYANRVSEELETIKSFLKHHPKEVAIIDFQHFYGLDESLKSIFKDLIKKVLGEMVEPYGSQIPSLAEMWSLKKQVIILGYAKSFDELEDDISVQWPSDWMQKSRPVYFFVFQGILSPNLDYILFNFTSGLEKLARLANTVVGKWLDGLKHLRGIVITDFSVLGFPGFARKERLGSQPTAHRAEEFWSVTLVNGVGPKCRTICASAVGPQFSAVSDFAA
ncbi:PI-PLC X domain-containing protein 3 [Echinococcus granulosus]|uniref:PI-PLC X domain-containing protein 3 n=1 Tax=Echinococcus granulosus TaxID=6210 RepID=W6UGJ2_ECHGR|nr:PI-PLC X domain-containing protein 3 [Echinococcus granulosus]EUB60096.1 PI-PLC X domain-containing protein 3 [Echinococcus granulosus]